MLSLYACTYFYTHLHKFKICMCINHAWQACRFQQHTYAGKMGHLQGCIVYHCQVHNKNTLEIRMTFDLLNELNVVMSTMLELSSTSWKQKFLAWSLHPILIFFVRHQPWMRNIVVPNLYHQLSKEGSWCSFKYKASIINRSNRNKIGK